MFPAQYPFNRICADVHRGPGVLTHSQLIRGRQYLVSLEVQISCQAQHTEPPGPAAARVGTAGSRVAFVWQAQYTEPPGPPAASVGAAGPRVPFVWQAQYTEP